MSIVLIDARSDSLTISWPPTPEATRYQLEYRTADDDDNTTSFELLSDKLTQSQARKRNLASEQRYFFRVAPIVHDTTGTTWTTHKEPFSTISVEVEKQAMAAPRVYSGGNQALFASWQAVEGAHGYELQMREHQGGMEWTTIGPSLTAKKVRKKNLTTNMKYQFRVRPLITDSLTAFSAPSDPVLARGLSPGIQRWFRPLENGTLLRSGVAEPVPLADALGGKEFVLLYASAHWCPPCRQFTPMLKEWYNAVRDNVEVVFLSCDHDENGFKNYFATHPWTAVAYDDDARENLLGAIKVSGIPRLVVISGDTGKILIDNAVRERWDLSQWRALAKK